MKPPRLEPLRPGSKPFRLVVDGKALGVFPGEIRAELRDLEHLRGIVFEAVEESCPGCL